MHHFQTKPHVNLIADSPGSSLRAWIHKLDPDHEHRITEMFFLRLLASLGHSPTLVRKAMEGGKKGRERERDQSCLAQTRIKLRFHASWSNGFESGA